MPALPAGPESTANERKTAAAIHLAGIFAPLWVPLIAYFYFRNSSRFIASHAWQEVIDGVVWKAILLLTTIGSLAWTAVRLAHHINTNWVDFTWQEMLTKLGISLAIFLTLSAWNIVQAIIQARKAWVGTWPKRELKKLAKNEPSPSLPQ
jgi:hypothetical protein